MKIIRKTLFMAAALASIGVASPAHADAFAQAILTIDNFKVLHSNGTMFSAADFGMLTGDNIARATATLNNTTFGAVPQYFGVLSGAGDVAHQLIGLGNTSHTENNFSHSPPPPAVPGTFGYADQYMSGSIISANGNSGGTAAYTRADASLTTNGSASGFSDVGTLTTFNFTLGVADSMTFEFDGTPFTQAYADNTNNLHTAAIARLKWEINIMNITTGQIVYSFEPGQLNSLGLVSRSDGFPGLSTYNPGTLQFSSSTQMLNNTDNYQLTISQITLANAMQSGVAVPEPASLAIFGLGLLGVGAFARRRTDLTI